MLRHHALRSVPLLVYLNKQDDAHAIAEQRREPLEQLVRTGELARE